MQLLYNVYSQTKHTYIHVQNNKLQNSFPVNNAQREGKTIPINNIIIIITVYAVPGNPDSPVNRG